MAIPQVNHPAYIIYRDVAPGETVDATSSLSFFPPKGSDELFDALREAFPLLKTHSERMRDAIIQFLLEERQSEQFELSAATTMESSQITWPSVSSGSASVFSSPDMPDFATPASFSESPQLRQASTATSSQASPPSLDQMTGVFSLSSNPQPKQRVRRKMTESEKIEYRKRRIVKACEKCAKRKRKCPHNQAEMKSIPTPSAKTSPESTISTTPLTQQLDAQFPAVFDESFDPTAFGSFGDFNMFDDPLPEFSVDDFFHFDQFQNSNNLFGNGTHDTLVPTHQLRQHVPENSNERISRLTTAQDRCETPSAELQTFSSLALPNVLQDTQNETQTHPSQRAVRDPRTDGSLYQSRLSRNVSDPLLNSDHDHSVSDSNRDRSLLSNSRDESLFNSDRDHSLLSSNRHDTLLSESDRLGDVPGRQSRSLGSSRSQELALTSTSVSRLGDSPVSRSAALQGRPQPTRLTNTPVLQEQTPGTHEDSRRQVSLGEGISRTDNIATELFMLRRRLPAPRRMETRGFRDHAASDVATNFGNKNTRGQQSSEQLSAQANGGAYLQLERSENPSAARGYALALSNRSNSSSKDGGLGGVHAAASGQDVASALAGDMVYQDRPSDHVHYREHHGRPQGLGLGLTQLVLALAAMTLLVMCSPGISVYGLALLFTTQSSSSDNGNSEGIVQCTAKNSSWLEAMKARDSPSGFECRALKNRQFLRGGGSQAGVSLFEGGPGAWLFGLMYPFSLSPVFAFA